MPVNNLQASEVPRKRPVSVRKAEANRQNSLKSTGPRSARGKANSRKNAIKHGLFVRLVDETFFNEGPERFLNFYNRLWNELQPVGPCEESEVEYIAVCWLRLARLWQYENAEIQAGREGVSERSERGCYSPYHLRPGRRELMTLLNKAQADVEERGQISPETMQQMFDEDVNIKIVWSQHEAKAEMAAKKKANEIAKEIAEARNISLNQARALLADDPKSQPQFTRFVAHEIVESFIQDYRSGWSRLSQETRKNDYRRKTIPDGRVVDKVIRYGNAIERHMSRAHARLERLQLRRKGEAVPPPMSIQLTR